MLIVIHPCYPHDIVNNVLEQLCSNLLMELFKKCILNIGGGGVLGLAVPTDYNTILMFCLEVCETCRATWEYCYHSHPSEHTVSVSHPSLSETLLSIYLQYESIDM